MIKALKKIIKYVYSITPPREYILHGLQCQGILKKKCNLCSSKVFRFLPAGNDYEIFKAKKISAGGRRANAICPICNSLDRERWVYHILKEYTDIFNEKYTVLHIAPEANIMKKLKEAECSYYSGDIQEGRADYIVDLTDVQFRDQFFDFIIVNHVLEHIPDEVKALKEVKRCLKRGGKFICSFPMLLEEKTYENDKIIEPEDRIAAFGQVDHCRMYGVDAKERLERAGFKATEYVVKKYVSKRDCEELSLIGDDCVFICEKTGD